MNTTTLAPTDEQVAALDLFAGGQSLAIQALAGTGKTTTLRLLAESTPRRGQYVAFNKALVEESKAKFPDTVACNTAHSLAFRQVGKRYAHRLKSGRMRSIDLAARLGLDSFAITTQDGQRKLLGAGYLAGVAMRTVERFCQSADLEPGEQHVPYLDGIDIPPGRWDNNKIVRKHIIGAVRKAWLDLQNPNGSLPYRHSHYLKQFQLEQPKLGADFILFDEAQDASPVMVAIVAAQEHAQLVWVGDGNQQIYSFTGAVNALKHVPADHQTYLTRSFRFGPEIADVANVILEALEAPLPIVGTPSVESTVGEIASPNVILTRTNAEAVRSVLSARRDGILVHLVGGGGEVSSFAKAARDLMQQGHTSHPELACFDSWSEVKTYVDQDEQGSELRLMVRLIEEFTVPVILDALERMPREENAALVVSTAHKSKGREWSRVKLAGDFPDDPSGEELRLLYVACTRARHVLDISNVAWFDQDEKEEEPERPEITAAVPATIPEDVSRGTEAQSTAAPAGGGARIPSPASLPATIDLGVLGTRSQVLHALAEVGAEPAAAGALRHAQALCGAKGELTQEEHDVDARAVRVKARTVCLKCRDLLDRAPADPEAHLSRPAVGRDEPGDQKGEHMPTQSRKRTAGRTNRPQRQRSSGATATANPPQEEGTNKVPAKQAAVTVLKRAGHPLKTDELAKRVLKIEGVSLPGKTPEATIAAMLSVENKKADGLFVRVERGTYDLRERVDGKPSNGAGTKENEEAKES